MPSCRQGLRLTAATADETPGNLARLKARYGDDIRIQSVERRSLLRQLEARFSSVLADRAVRGLEQRFPEFSARQRVSAMQLGLALALILVVGVGVWANVSVACLVLSVIWSVSFVANVLFRTVMVWVGAGTADAAPARATPKVPDGALPLYSIIVPLYREASILPDLHASLCALDYGDCIADVPDSGRLPRHPLGVQS